MSRGVLMRDVGGNMSLDISLLNLDGNMSCDMHYLMLGDHVTCFRPKSLNAMSRDIFIFLPKSHNGISHDMFPPKCHDYQVTCFSKLSAKLLCDRALQELVKAAYVLYLFSTLQCNRNITQQGFWSYQIGYSNYTGPIPLPSHRKQ